MRRDHAGARTARPGLRGSCTRLIARALATAAWAALALAGAAHAGVAVRTASPKGEIQLVRQARVTFGEPMVKFGDPRLPAPMDVSCTPAAEQAGTSRWVDDRTWVFDFAHDLPPGTRCSVAPRAGVKSVAGEPLGDDAKFAFDTGGPAIVRATPRADAEYERIEEDQAFALLLNGGATKESIEKNAWCEVSGIGERVPVRVWTGPDREAIVQVAGAAKQQARFVVLSCTRPAPPDSTLTLVWGAGIASTAGGSVVTTAPRRLQYHVRPAFSASFTCQRENSRADCLPILPLRVEFSSPVPRRLAERVVLRAPDGVHKPRFETHRGETTETDVTVRGSGFQRLLAIFTRERGRVGDAAPQETVSAVEFAGPLPENADLKIELPAGFVDESGRALDNASLFPLSTRTGRAPPLAKFPNGATFGILELNAEPMLPVTLRHVEGDLGIRTVSLGGATAKDLDVTDDAAIMRWMARLREYDERSLKREVVEKELGIRLPPPAAPVNARPTKRYGRDVAPGDAQDEEGGGDGPGPEDARYVQSRSVPLLAHEPAARRVQLPADQRTDPHPFEVVGIPLPAPGYHVVEIESPRLGQALLDRAAPMYVRTGVLVTNLGVHFKWAPVNSGVWVTTLDKARPVEGAAVRISDCLGQEVWRGTTDAHGFALVAKALPRMEWRYCRNADDDGTTEVGYFVSARATDRAGRADLAFVWSTWQQGIESWRFNLRSWDSTAADAPVYHSVLDRTLLRAGQTVSFKHYGRRQLLTGLALPLPGDLPTTLQLIHEGSGQKFTQPLEWRAGRYAESAFHIPEDAKLGVYDVQLTNGTHTWATGSFRVEEFRLPVMTGRIVPPKGEQVAPKELPLQVAVEYGNGGGAAGLPVRVSAQLRDLGMEQAVPVARYPGFSFALPRDPQEAGRRSPFHEEYVDEDDDEQAVHARAGDARLVADKRPLVLDRAGGGQLVLDKLPALKKPAELLVQATYADPNGEVQTLSQTVPLWPSAVVLGVRADDWVSVGKKMATQVVALDTSGRPKAGVDVTLRAVMHREVTARKRLVGGFYAYDDHAVDEDLGEVCTGRSDARGLVFCEVSLAATGNVELVAEAKDANGHAGRAAASVWITGQNEIWFGSQNDDRMDVVPEKRTYQAGEVARFQVRSPFRHATVLVAVERNGIIRTFEQEVDGKDPTVEVQVEADWAPNVFVSVLAVRGRVREVPWYSFFTWGWKSPAEWWHAWRDEGADYQAPTAMVDLSKPAFRLGVAEIEVGRAGHELKVQVVPDQSTYPIRATSHVKVHVALPDGRPAPAGSEVAIAAVDEALLSLLPNDSWNLIDAMIRHRSYGVETSTAQMQIIGKRHFGKKAAPPGGGGGQFPTRELFDTLLLWNPRVVLDANGDATVDVPLNDALTSFRIVAVADVVQGPQAALFGTGKAVIRATQDLQLVSGVPPLVREGDHYRAMFTLRNTTSQPMQADVAAKAGDTTLPAQRVRLEANASADVAWDVDVPFNVRQLAWSVAADAARAHDRLKITQKVAEAVPVTVQQSTLMQLDKPLRMPIAVPAGALVDASGAPRGGVELALRPKLGDGLGGVREYFWRYPWACLEQRASIAIGLHDPAEWKAVMARLPLYLDADGLANYFPPGPGDDHRGSDSLTAYLLSISDEATRLGDDFQIPEESRAAMEHGLVEFVEGRLNRDFWHPAFLRNGDLDVRKLAALEALSRSGKVRARMLDSIQLLPNQWPTGAVIDWLQVLQRVPDLPDRAARIEEAEQVLRARLNVQGTRLGFSTERDDSWWWLMANGDVNSVRMILAVLDRPGWKDDLPRLVTGTLQRQQYGHWSTTVSNAWGTVAMQAFSKRFERDPVTGITRAAFEGGGASTIDWSRTPAGGTLALGWPKAAGAKAAGPGGAGSAGNAGSAGSAANAGAAARADGVLVASQEGTGRPWLTVTSKAAVPVLRPFSSGYRITKTITPVDPKVAGRSSRGDVVRVKLEIDVQADATWVVISDPVPAGATILGNGLGRDDALATQTENEDERGWLAYQERSFEAFRAYYRYLPKGTFKVEYTMRLNNPGRFGLPATHVEAMYAPEMFGEAPNAAWVVEP